MKISELFNKNNTVLSFELFPPKRDTTLKNIDETLEVLSDLNPDYISVTYGAGGSIKNNKTTELSSLIKNKYEIETVSHLTCIDSTKEEIQFYLNGLRDNNIENILALRGDIPATGHVNGELKHANELIEFINSSNENEFNIAAACYPEGHIENKSLSLEIESMKRKEAAGASCFISQLFFNNESFYYFIEQVRRAGICAPIEAGIMPVTNKNQIERMISLSGASLPTKFKKIIDRFEHNPEALRDAGIAYAVEQIVDLVSTDVDGIHLYVMNNSYIANRICDGIKSIRSCCM